MKQILIYIATLTLFFSLVIANQNDSLSDVEVVNGGSKIQLPPWMPICNRNAPPKERNLCIKNSINKLLPLIKNGIPSLNVSSIDPFAINYTNIQYNEGPLLMQIEMMGAKCNGLSRGRVKNVRSKMNSTSLVILLSMFFPQLDIQGDFKGETHLGEAVVTSNGQVNITGALITTTIKIFGNTQMIHGKEFMIINEMQIAKNELKGMRTDADGLSNDKDLNALVVEFVNQNWEALYLQFFPQLKILFEPLFVDYVNEFFGQVPYDVLMPMKYD